MYTFFAQPLTLIPGVGPTLEKRLSNRGVEAIGDLLLHLPKTYIDDRQITPIAQLIAGQQARITGRIIEKHARGYGRNRQVTLKLSDDSGLISLSFFHSGYMMNDARLSEGRTLSVRAEAERWHGQWQMSHPEWCVAESFRPGFRPVYGSLAGLNGKRIQTLIAHVLTLMPTALTSPLDAILQAQRGMPTLAGALEQLHAPEVIDRATIERAMSRLKSEEAILYLHLMREKRAEAASPAPALAGNMAVEALLDALPWSLTEAQQQVWHEIANDMRSGRRMHRLLQGDVGAGKTVIAALAMAMAADSGGQVALLAPTEVLAQQHAETLRALLQPTGFEPLLLTGSTKAKARRTILSALQQGSAQLIVGTHALLSDDVHFHRLALALVDEQHRFGVRQRWALAEKQGGEAVHLLGMSATPIPRSLALALYGDLDLSVMHGMPPGRLPVETRVITAEQMKPLADGMQRMLDAGGSIYWIVPRIDEDEDGVSVDQRSELLSGYFPDAHVVGLHGRMKARNKQAALSAFASGDCRILVSTTVVEVGVNVPEARLIVIEQAESYGLAQLHQLRGRVGRSDQQSYCMLIASSAVSAHAMQRLQRMVTCHDGMELAEADLELRGGGDAIGARQHGDAGFRLIDPAADGMLIREWFEDLPTFSPGDAMQRFWRPLANTTD